MELSPHRTALSIFLISNLRLNSRSILPDFRISIAEAPKEASKLEAGSFRLLKLWKLDTPPKRITQKKKIRPCKTDAYFSATHVGGGRFLFTTSFWFSNSGRGVSHLLFSFSTSLVKASKPLVSFHNGFWGIRHRGECQNKRAHPY